MKTVKKLLSLSLALILVLSLVGCSSKYKSTVVYDIPEAKEIQIVLNDMSDAIMKKNPSKYSTVFSDACAQKEQKMAQFKSELSRAPYSNYIQTIKKSKRMGYGVICSIEIYYELNNNGKKTRQILNHDLYFVQENGNWKIADFNYHPYSNPAIVTSNDSVFEEAANTMAQALASKVYADTTHLQTYGDIILLGTAYDNASILDMESRGLTQLKVTEDYPEVDSGVVQVLANIDNYRHVIIIQSPTEETEKSSIEFMTKYLKENPYIFPGVYFIKNDRLKNADPLELSTLSIPDLHKTEDKLTEVQKYVETTISTLEGELQTEREDLTRTMNNMDNPYHEDFYTAFTRYDHYLNPPQGNGMVLTAANFTDKDLCTTAFELPQGSNAGTIYACADYSARNLSYAADSFPEAADGDIWSEGQGALRKEAAYEMKGFSRYIDTLAGDYQALASYNTALLRLTGFSEAQVYNVSGGSRVANFIDLDKGYVLDSSAGENTDVDRGSRADMISAMENEGNYIDFEHQSSNLNKEAILSYTDKLNEVYTLKNTLSKSKFTRNTFKENELTKTAYIPYSTEDIYTIIKNTVVVDDNPCVYASLSEARAKLREVMGELLSVKCTQQLMNLASKYPGSQYDYARFAAGFISLEHPTAYAQGAEKAKLTESYSHNIVGTFDSSEVKLQSLTNFLFKIEDAPEFTERFVYPDFCLINKAGSPRDKALLAYGLYCNMFKDNESAYVALGRDSAYLAFKDDSGWRFIDCRDNTLKYSISDEIYLAFNKYNAYNGELETGAKPEFIE